LEVLLFDDPRATINPYGANDFKFKGDPLALKGRPPLAQVTGLG